MSAKSRTDSTSSIAGRRVKHCERAIIPFGPGAFKSDGASRNAARKGEEIEAMTKFEGRCFCGAVQIEAQGDPEAMGYCHCHSCRSWSAAPVNAFTLWRPQNVKLLKGAEYLGHAMKTPASDRQFCQRCGGHLMTDHPPLGLVDVYAATLPGLTFSPELHVNYAETVLPMKDGLPKLKDFPAEFGGSGVAVPE
jgi:hypothetical protein